MIGSDSKIDAMKVVGRSIGLRGTLAATSEAIFAGKDSSGPKGVGPLKIFFFRFQFQGWGHVAPTLGKCSQVVLRLAEEIFFRGDMTPLASRTGLAGSEAVSVGEKPGWP